MCAALSQNKRLGKAALLPKPEIGLFRQLFDRILSKKLGSDLLLCTFVGECLGSVLAKFIDRPAVFRIRPGTRLAVDPALLIQIQQPARAANHAHLAEHVLQRDWSQHARPPTWQAVG